MSTAKVTVGIPTFNRSGLLREAIESVLAQTYTDFRLIVCDNASEDDTPEVVRSFADERIDYVRLEHNIGGALNLSGLVGRAGTEYLMLLPDDDVIYPDHLRAAVEVLDRFEDVGLAYTGFDLIDERSRVTRTMHPLGTRSKVRVERRDRALERLMVADFPMCFSSVVYRTRAIVGAGGLRPEEGPFNDIQMWMRIALDWDFGYVATSLAGLRIHDASATQNIAAQHRATPDQRDLALMHAQMRLERRAAFLAEAPLEPRRARRLRSLATLHDLAERAYWGLPSREVVAGQAELVRTYPRIAQRPAFWRLAVAQLGARRAASALRGAVTRPGRSEHAPNSQV